MLKTSTIIMAAVAVFGTAQLVSAQGYNQGTHYDNVPHTTTHTDYVRHRFHVDAVPHTTTHVDRQLHTNYGQTNAWFPRSTQNYNYQSTNQYQPRSQYQSTNQYNYAPQYQPRYAPHTTTHYDRVQHGNHVDVNRHTTTHWDRR